MKTVCILVAGVGFMLNSWFLKSPAFLESSSDIIDAVMRSDTAKKDSTTGLFLDKNLYMVKAQCTSCHSPKLISQNRFTRDGWKQKIRWMQANHNLWDLGEAEPVVLDYLEKYYSPSQSYSRRAPLKGIEWYRLEEK